VIAAHAGRALDTPWLLLASLPALTLAKALVAASAIVPVDPLVALAVVVAARRWGLAALPPTLVICLCYLVQFPSLGGSGDIWMIPVLLVASLLGHDPAFLSEIRRRRKFNGVDRALLFLLLMSGPSELAAFRPDFAIVSHANETLAPVMLGLIGASSIRLRWPLALVAIALASTWLLSSLNAHGVEFYFVQFNFGLQPTSAIICIISLLMGYVITHEIDSFDRHIFPVLIMFVICVWFILLIFAADAAKLHITLFDDGRVGTARLSSDLVPWSVISMLSVTIWRFREINLRRKNRRRLHIDAAMILIFILTFIWIIFPLTVGQANPNGFYGSLASIDMGPAVIVDERIRALSLIVISIISVAVTESWRAANIRIYSPVSRSFYLIIFGRYWAVMLAGQLMLVTSLSLISMLSPLPSLEELRRVNREAERPLGGKTQVFTPSFSARISR